MTAKARLVLQQGSPDHCLAFTIHHIPDTELYTVVRTTEDGETLGYYTDEKTAIKDQQTWFVDQVIVADRAQRAIEQRLKEEMDRVEAGGCLSHIPSQCGCGDCLTTMAGEVYADKPPKDHHSGDDCNCEWCSDYGTEDEE